MKKTMWMWNGRGAIPTLQKKEVWESIIEDWINSHAEEED